MNRKNPWVPEVIVRAIESAKDDHADIVASMPDKAKTPGQRRLMRKHGTPKVFAAGVVDCIGEISVLEANLAIRKYRDEWNAA